MSVTYTKLFTIWNFQKEEAWINQMSKNGLQLISPGWVHFTFVNGKPNEYQYRLEMLPHYPSHPKSQDYIHFVEETGAEYIGSVKRWVYFRKKTEDGPFELISDLQDRISHFRRINVLLVILLAFLLMYPAIFVLPRILRGIVPYPSAAFVSTEEGNYIVTMEHPEEYTEFRHVYTKKDAGKLIKQTDFQEMKKIPYHMFNQGLTISLLDVGMYANYSPWIAVETEGGYILKKNNEYVRQRLDVYSPLYVVLFCYVLLFILILSGMIGMCIQIRYLKREARIRES